MSQGLGGIKEKLGGVNLGAIALGGAAVGGAVALGKALFDMGKLAAAEEVGIAKLGAAVKASGGDWGVAEAAIESYLAAELKRTALDDGDGREAIARLTTTTGDYKTALDLMGLAQDLAAAKGISLSSAAEIVGKVHEGNTGVLSRYGITLAEGATATEAIAAMQSAFAGQAEAYGNTQEGASKKFDIALGNLKETIGGMVLPVMTALMTILADLAMQAMPIVEAAIQAAQPVFETVFGWIQDNVVPILTEVVGYVVDHWPEIYATIEAVMTTVWEIIKTLWGYIEETITNVMDIVQGVIRTVTGLIAGDWDEVWGGIEESFGGVWAQIQNILETGVGIVKTVFGAFGIDITSVWKGIETTIGGVIQSIQGFFDGIRIPHIPTPHINVWTSPGALGIPIPHVDVQWYQHGLDAIISRPTLIGVGEAGAERVQVTPLGGGSGGGNDALINAVRALVVSQSELIQAMGGATRAMSLLRQYDLEASLR
jgi:hypothetical protein